MYYAQSEDLNAKWQFKKNPLRSLEIYLPLSKGIGASFCAKGRTKNILFLSL